MKNYGEITINEYTLSIIHLSISSTFLLQSYGDAGVHLGHVASLSQG